MIPNKIVFIGAASAAFGPRVIGEACRKQEIAASTLVLVDINKDALEVMTKWANKVNTGYGSPLKIESTTDRLQALPDANFVIVSIAVERNELWKLDWRIPLKHGIKQVLGENGGPGGLSHSLRNIPIVLGIAKDMERLCPKALMMIYTNPENRITMAVERYSEIRAVGLCPGWGDSIVAAATGVPQDDILLVNGGLNHFGWLLDIRRKSTGEDLYPLFRKAAAEAPPDVLPLSRHLFEIYGYFPRPSDDHVGEYISYAWQFCGLDGYDFDAADQVRAQQWADVLAIANGEKELVPMTGNEAAQHGIGEPCRPGLEIIAGIANGTPTYIPSMNIVNARLGRGRDTRCRWTRRTAWRTDRPTAQGHSCALPHTGRRAGSVRRCSSQRITPVGATGYAGRPGRPGRRGRRELLGRVAKGPCTLSSSVQQVSNSSQITIKG